MNGVHEDEVGSQFVRPIYRLGSIIRSAERWGIVIKATGGLYHSDPYDIVWWGADGQWIRKLYATPPDRITYPIAYGDPSIPDEVLAKATHIRLDPPQ